MDYQLEITTRCNYSCSYCAGRKMAQQDMSWETFISIVDRIDTKSNVTLQGEGEPTLHPKFWDMVDYVSKKGHVIHTTLNGTQLDTELIPKYFKQINISIDSLDAELCNSIGRINLPKVLRNLEELVKVIPPQAITLRTVDFGQPLDDLKQFVNKNNFKWWPQLLQQKKDYTSTYTGKFINIATVNAPRTTLCSYLRKDIVRYYTVTGLELPCFIIKDTTGITTIDNMKRSMPGACIGCKM
jgi:MoaA/NifB/PqqE/SkfB family radical SAM enzyme